ncbi:hypothetical protein CEXT_425541 [Caerostris extrusa]|uniref:Uncharacterized protein n=1 Tax=Caerostris extrusa TaxID=172846 RepID=A0AAV4TZX4_CAEEX|nr:hypothetical protein CEXT_425541 [Caerostris extrusa]
MGAGTAKLMSFLGFPYAILRKMLSRKLSTFGSGMGAGTDRIQLVLLVQIPIKDINLAVPAPIPLPEVDSFTAPRSCKF